LIFILIINWEVFLGIFYRRVAETQKETKTASYNQLFLRLCASAVKKLLFTFCITCAHGLYWFENIILSARIMSLEPEFVVEQPVTGQENADTRLINEIKRK
jgi:hypothetical protein